MNIGIVLSGGMAKGAYHIGALQAIEELIPKNSVTVTSASSIGALNAYAYNCGKLELAKNLWGELCHDNMRISVGKLLKSSLLQSIVNKLCSDCDYLTHDFYITLYDAAKNSLIYKNLRTSNKKDIPLLLKASIAMPIYNTPVKIDSASYFDGAMIDNIPIFPLAKHKLDHIICVYFDDVCYTFENSDFDKKVIKITFPSENFIRQSIIFEKNSIEQMIKEGYEKTFSKLSFIFGHDINNMINVYEKAELLNKTITNREMRITGDMLVTNLNKVTKKFTKRKVIY